MKKLILSILLICSINVAEAATASNPRGQGASSAGTSSGSTVSRNSGVTARSATSTRTSLPVSSAVSARSATTGRTTVSRTPSASNSVNSNTGVSARAGATKSVIGTGTTVAAAQDNLVASEACRQKYYGCMDSFCMLDNTNGGRCICSDKNAEYDEILAQIEELDLQSYQMATYGVERIEMGDAADVAIANAEAVAQSITGKNKEEDKKTLDLNSWMPPTGLTNISIFEDVEDLMSPIEGKEGDALYKASHEICIAQMPECGSELSMLQLMYAQQIRNDCAAYENSLKEQKNASTQKLYAAEQALREAALEQYQNTNKYDLGQCTVEFKKCMVSTGGCGEDFSGCAPISAFDSTSTRGNKKAPMYKIEGDLTSIEIHSSTYDILVSKKPLCENVTKQCQLVADQVWDTFLKDVAPQIKSAELIAENNLRQNCIGNISSCFQQACKDTIDPNDPEGSYDLCLTRPESMLNLCQVPLNACGISTTSASEAQKSDIWDFIVARLASMRVNSCVTQFKECLQSEDRCGEDYTQCIGLDLDTVRNLCPISILTSCQLVENGQDQVVSTAELDNILQGIFLDLDNSLLEECQEIATSKMIELCGDTATCFAFDDDSVMGTESLLGYENSDGDYVIDGLMSFGNVTVKRAQTSDDDIQFGQYEININDYKNHLEEEDDTAERVINTLRSTSNKINQKIMILTQDPKILMCTQGRSLTEIRPSRAMIGETNNSNNRTAARFPYLLDSSIMAIINAGLDKARENYTNKYNELVGEALEKQNDAVKSGICAAMAHNPNSGPTCVKTAETGVCLEYEYQNPYEGLFNDSSNAGMYGDGYSTYQVITGTSLEKSMEIAMSGHGEFVQTDEFGNMLGTITISSVYSMENNECNLTTTTVMCEEAENVITTDKVSVNKAKRDARVTLGDMSVSADKKVKNATISRENYHGTSCKKFSEPIVKTNVIEM